MNRRKKGEDWNLPPKSALSEIWGHWIEKYVPFCFFVEVFNVSHTAVRNIEGESGGQPTKQLRAEPHATGCPDSFRGFSQSLKENRDKS